MDHCKERIISVDLPLLDVLYKNLSLFNSCSHGGNMILCSDDYNDITLGMGTMISH